MTRLDRWTGGLAASAALAGVGVLSNADALLVAATIPLVYVVYGSLTRVSLSAEDVVVERAVEKTGAFPGDRIDVELRVRNEGDGPLPDLRVVDGVPDALPVVDGSPRGAFALRAGEEGVVEYTVVANRGDHEFDPARVRARSLSATAARTVEVDPDGPDAIACNPYVDEVPLRVQTTQYAGRVRTDSGGSGVEFHSTREYQHGDPVNRIDWRRLARGEELATVDFREHRAARVVMVVDARDVCHVAPRAGVPTGAAMSAYGAARAMAALLSDGHQVGLAAFGVTDRAGIDPAWVEPGRGEELSLRVREVLDRAATRDDVGANMVAAPDADGGGDDGAQAGSVTTREGGGKAPAPDGGETRPPDGGGDPIDVLRDRLPPDAQVLVFSPLVDTFPRRLVRKLSAYGHGVTVVSPSVTHGDTAGGKLRRTERGLLIDELRDEGARTIDWRRDRPLPLVLTEALREVVA